MLMGASHFNHIEIQWFILSKFDSLILNKSSMSQNLKQHACICLMFLWYFSFNTLYIFFHYDSFNNFPLLFLYSLPSKLYLTTTPSSITPITILSDDLSLLFVVIYPANKHMRFEVKWNHYCASSTAYNRSNICGSLSTILIHLCLTAWAIHLTSIQQEPTN